MQQKQQQHLHLQQQQQQVKPQQQLSANQRQHSDESAVSYARHVHKYTHTYICTYIHIYIATFICTLTVYLSSCSLAFHMAKPKPKPTTTDIFIECLLDGLEHHATFLYLSPSLDLPLPLSQSLLGTPLASAPPPSRL